MLYVMMNYKSMTSDYCFHTSNILTKQKTSTQNHKITSFEITKESIKVTLKCKNTLLSTKLFQNVICNDELQAHDFRLSFSCFKSSQKHKSSSQNPKFFSFETKKESVKVTYQCKNTLFYTKLFQNVIF